MKNNGIIFVDNPDVYSASNINIASNTDELLDYYAKDNAAIMCLIENEALIDKSGSRFVNVHYQVYNRRRLKITKCKL